MLNIYLLVAFFIIASWDLIEAIVPVNSKWIGNNVGTSRSTGLINHPINSRFSDRLSNKELKLLMAIEVCSILTLRLDLQILDLILIFELFLNIYSNNADIKETNSS